jgi:hypothetical protein
MIFDIRNPLHLRRLMIGRAQTRRAWRLPLEQQFRHARVRAGGGECCSEEI